MYTPNRNSMIDALGTAGEKIVANELSSLGLTVIHSINKFDSVKDMVVDGKTVEVKTQVPFVMENAFTIRQNQLVKCRNVDVLFFVSVKPPRNSYRWGGWLFRAVPNQFGTFDYKTRDGRYMILIPIEQSAIIPIRQLTIEENSQLSKFTVSGF